MATKLNGTSTHHVPPQSSHSTPPKFTQEAMNTTNKVHAFSGANIAGRDHHQHHQAQPLHERPVVPLQQHVHVGRGHREEQPPVIPMQQSQHQVTVVPVQQQQAQAFAAHQVLQQPQHPPQQPQVRVPVGRGHLGQQQ